MTTSPAHADPYIILYGISWEQYEKILDALGECHLRHAYTEGTLEMRSLLYGVSWEAYEKFLEAMGDHCPRHSYNGDTLEMMSPRKDHDWRKKLIGRMVELMTFELNIPIQSVGSTTLSGKHVEKGIQPDEAYYIANERLVRGKRDFEPDKDPPPDLTIEVDVTHSCVKRMPLFAQVKIPEVWRHDQQRLIFYRLTDDGDYEEIANSLAFPFLGSTDMNRFLDRWEATDELSLLREFIDWVKEQPMPENEDPTDS